MIRNVIGSFSRDSPVISARLRPIDENPREKPPNNPELLLEGAVETELLGNRLSSIVAASVASAERR